MAVSSLCTAGDQAGLHCRRGTAGIGGVVRTHWKGGRLSGGVYCFHPGFAAVMRALKVGNLEARRLQRQVCLCFDDFFEQG